jgi:hypothetical protein
MEIKIYVTQYKLLSLIEMVERFELKLILVGWFMVPGEIHRPATSH